MVTILAALPLAVLTIRAITMDVRGMLDACTQWGAGNSGPFYHSLDDPCRQRTFMSETRRHAAVRLALVPGMILLASTIGIWGVLRSRWKLSLVGGSLMMLEAVPLGFSVWPLALLSGGAFLWFGSRTRRGV